MRRRVRALPVILIGVFAVVTTSTTTASALTGSGADPVAPPRVSHAKSSTTIHSTTRATKVPKPRNSATILEIAPVGDASAGASDLAVNLDPGASRQRSFTVTNRSASLRLTIALATVDATTGSDGDVRYAATASSDGPASWVTLSDLIETLEPGASARVALTVAPPADSLPGAVSAGLVARVDSAARAADGAAVSAHASVWLPISIKVNGAPTALVSVSGVGAVKDNGREYLEITFQNAGETANTMVGQVQVRGKGGNTYALHAAVAPLKRTTVRLPFAMPKGAKTASVSVATEDGAGDQADWSGPVGFGNPSAPAGAAPQKSSAPGPAASSPAGVSSLPRPALVLVVSALVVAAIWFAAELRRNRSRRRRSGAVTPGVGGAFATYAFGASDPLGAVVSQLGSLVEAIDRLVAGLSGSHSPVAVPAAAAAAPAPAPPVPEAAPERPPAMPTRAELTALLLGPATATVPEFDENDPYDWPTQAQLDQFADRHRLGRDRPE